jgi:hypothetical protein
MTEFLFPSFLKDAREYEEAERLWESRWRDLVEAARQTRLWRSRWFNTRFANGTPCRDGNPIFSAVNRKKRIGIRVIQLEPGKDAVEISHWIDEFGQEESDPIKELVISCALTEQTLRQATDLMRQWLTQKDGKRRSGPKKALGRKS